MVYAWLFMTIAFTLVLGYAWWRRRLHVLSPMMWFLLTYALLFVLRPFVMIVTNDYRRLNYSVPGATDQMVLLAAGMSVLGLICFTLAFELSVRLRVGRKLRLPNIRWTRVETIGTGVVLAGLAFYVMYRTGVLPGFGGSGPGLRGFDVLGAMQSGQTAYVLLAPYLASATVLFWASRFGLKWWVLALAGLVWFVGLYGGWHRWTVVLSALGLAMIEVARHRRRRLFMAFLIVSPMAILLLSALSRARGLLPAVLSGRTTLKEHLRVSSGAINWETDLSMFEGLTWCVWAFPRHSDYELGSSIIEAWFLGPIPRRFWPDKPAGSHRHLWSRAPITIPGGGLSKSVFGTTYIDFGALGVALGLGLLGAFSGLGYNLFRRYRGRAYAVYIYCTMLALLPIVVRSGFAPMAVYLFFWLAPGVVATGLAMVRTTVVGVGNIALAPQRRQAARHPAR